MHESQIQVKLNPDVQPTGSDLAVVNAARRSFNTRSEWTPESQCPTDPITGGKIPSYKRLKDKDKRLIQFLARGMTTDDFEKFFEDLTFKSAWYSECRDQRDFEQVKELLWKWRNTPTHDTPFNHCFISFEVKLPVFTARQLVKTEYTIISEISRRYITGNLEFYEHTYRNQSSNKKQGSEGLHYNDGKWVALSRENSIRCVELYDKMIDDGVAIEQARGELPANLMVEWTWSGTLGAMAKMCRERLGNDAQYETRLVAQQVYEYLKEYYPVSAKALVEGPDV